jgi:hypothetical protein
MGTGSGPAAADPTAACPPGPRRLTAKQLAAPGPAGSGPGREQGWGGGEGGGLLLHSCCTAAPLLHCCTVIALLHHYCSMLHHNCTVAPLLQHSCCSTLEQGVPSPRTDEARHPTLLHRYCTLAIVHQCYISATVRHPRRMKQSVIVALVLVGARTGEVRTGDVRTGNVLTRDVRTGVATAMSTSARSVGFD